MPSPIDQPPGSWQLVEWLVVALVGLVQLIFGYQIVRIGKLEESKADKDDVKDLIEEVRADRAERRDELRDAAKSRSDLHDKVNDIALSVAELRGKVGGG